jgi:hypothetical protein
MNLLKKFLLENKISEFKNLKNNKVALSPEERTEVIRTKAVWQSSSDSKPTPAVWKSVLKNGKTKYVTNTHRAYNTASTLKGAIKKFHTFIKGTA